MKKILKELKAINYTISVFLENIKRLEQEEDSQDALFANRKLLKSFLSRKSSLLDSLSQYVNLDKADVSYLEARINEELNKNN